MNYYDKVDELLLTYEHPCDKEVPPGYYRRVMWEKYNPTGAQIQPGNKEEWDTEIIKKETRLYDKNPFGLSSELFPEPPVEEGSVPCSTWSTKIGYCFKSQAELEAYVASIGSVLLPGNQWYGADLSKSHLFKTQHESLMYQIENIGGTWHTSGPRIDPRTMLRVDNRYNIYLNYNCLRSSRCAYMKHYEDRECTFVGITLNLNVDLGIPGKPVSEPPSIGPLPPEVSRQFRSIGCIPFSAKFPYNGLTKAILESWNTTRHSFKLIWDDVPGIPTNADGYMSTMYDHLSTSMEELGVAALEMGQYVTQLAWLTFKEVISQALNIVGGAWDLLKSFLPSITIMGVSIDIEDLCTSSNGLNDLKNAFKGMDLEKVIQGIYSAIGSAYDYSIEYVKTTSRDLVDALMDLYDWCWTQLQMGGVALCKMLADIAQIWSMPPEVPNPVWSVITAVKNMFKQVEPLDMIMSGNFPGFTASDIYALVQQKIKDLIDQTYAQIEVLKEQMLVLLDQIKETGKQLAKATIELKQYVKGMLGPITEEGIALKEQAIQELEDKKTELNDKKDQLNSLINGEQMSVSDILKIGMDHLTQLPIVAQINQLLDLLGASIDSLVDMYDNSVTGAKSVYHNFTSGSRSMKDICKSIYNQVSTLTLSKVTQWVNKLLSVLGLEIVFPELSICIPYIKYEDPNE